MSSVRGRDGLTFVVSVLYGVIELTLAEYRSVLSEIEIEVIRIGRHAEIEAPQGLP